MAKTRRGGKTTKAGNTSTGGSADPPASKRSKAAPKRVAQKTARKKASSSTTKKTAKKADSKRSTSKKATAKKVAKKKTSKKASAKKAAPKKSANEAPEATAAENAAASESGPRKWTAETMPPPPSDAKLPVGWGAHPDAGLSVRQLNFLYGRLVEERERKVAELERHMEEALGEAGVMPDETDMAQRHTEQAYLMRFADKERKLLSEIERALDKLRNQDYGVCEGTEEPIGFKRLELRPWTRYSVAYKEQVERERSQHRR